MPNRALQPMVTALARFRVREPRPRLNANVGQTRVESPWPPQNSVPVAMLQTTWAQDRANVTVMSDENGEVAGGVFGDSVPLAPDGRPALPPLARERSPGERLKEIADDLTQGRPSPRETVRSFLSWFDAERRGYKVVALIRAELDGANLVTDPDFEAAYIDAHIFFALKASPNVESPDDQGKKGEQPPSPPAQGDGDASSSNTVPPSNTSTSRDASLQLRKLDAANRAPLSVRPDTPLIEAVTTMLLHDYSQLPVMQSDREVKGAISWSSIASRLATGNKGTLAREFMDPVDVLESTFPIFDAIQVIVAKQFVLVRAPDKKIAGIVTSSDLSLQFQLMTEPFLLLSEIESNLRSSIEARFEASDLAAAKDPNDKDREVNTVHDMTFGEYIRLLEKPERWAKYAPKLDRGVFNKGLIRVKELRNDVMHFDPDGMSSHDLEFLREFSSFMRRLKDLGVA